MFPHGNRRFGDESSDEDDSQEEAGDLLQVILIFKKLAPKF